MSYAVRLVLKIAVTSLRPLYTVYDVNSRQTFERLPNWLSEMESYINRNDVVKMLVANKIDLNSRQVSH